MSKIDVSTWGAATLLLGSLLIVAGVLPALASDAYTRPAVPADPVFDGEFASALIMDAATGEVLAAKEPHLRRQPASMVKMMTELIILEAIDAGGLTLRDPVTVSAKSSRMGGSQVYLKEGEVFTVEELLKALAIHSANDASVALAEYHAGSVEAFLDLMNTRAFELGMRNTIFHSVHGLPPGWRQDPDFSCAYDMALLARELVKHPHALAWSSTATAPFRDGAFTLYNPNHLIGRYRGLDGLKTGYHSQAGYCVTATALQQDRRLITVVMGAASQEMRATETTRLLTHGFSQYTRVTLVARALQPLEKHVRVKGGQTREVAIAYAEPLVVSVRKGHADEIVLEEELAEKVSAPIAEGQVVGKVVAKLGARPLGEVAIVALEPVARGSFFQRLFNQ